jgi:hypothetical protein
MVNIKVGICGKMCSGKSYIANQLSMYYNNCPILSFASMIKQIAKDVFGMEKKDRYLLQSIGTKLRDIKETVWIDYTINQSKQHNICIIDDVRYEDEIIALQKDNWVLIKLHISPEKQLERLKIKYPFDWKLHVQHQDHVSEQVTTNHTYFDCIIDMDTQEDVAISIILDFLKSL